jgi:hypothetical protein
MCLRRKNDAMQNVTSDPTNYERFFVTKNVLVFGLAAVSILGIVAIVFTSIWGEKGETITNVKDILTMLLPLIGAWVGTVLAFYFSKDNFKAASDSTRDLFKTFKTSEEKLKTIRISDVMIKEDTMTKLILTKDESEIKLKTDIMDNILEKNKNNPINRLPVLTVNLHPKYIIHRSLFDKFFVKMVLDKKNIEDLTLSDMSKDPEFENALTKSFGTIRESSNLAEAKHIIDNVTSCQDVFVTETGEPNSKVIGWVTNVLVAKASEI